MPVIRAIKMACFTRKINKPTKMITVVMETSVNCAFINPNNAFFKSLNTVTLLDLAFDGSHFKRKFFRRSQSLLIKKVARREKINTDAALGIQEKKSGIFSKKDFKNWPTEVTIALPIFSIFVKMVSCCPASRLLNIWANWLYNGMICEAMKSSR